MTKDCFGSYGTLISCECDDISGIPCGVAESCKELTAGGAVIIAEETDPNERACFGADLAGYCEIRWKCKSWRDCNEHTNKVFIGERTMVVILEES